jgi:hypothetical protein
MISAGFGQHHKATLGAGSGDDLIHHPVQNLVQIQGRIEGLLQAIEPSHTLSRALCGSEIHAATSSYSAHAEAASDRDIAARTTAERQLDLRARMIDYIHYTP